MIEEAYVSFETAKLLKEKGFDEDCQYWYEEDSSEPIRTNDDYGNQSNSDHISKDFICAVPTQQMAMCWLREKHYLWIDIDLITGYKWTWSIWFMNDSNLKMGESSQVTSTYEDTVKAAIQYSLKNLI